MSKGIYKYTDLKTGDIVYIGKDSHIDKKQRHRDHNNSKKYDEQQINRVLQNNPNRYEYGVIWASDDCSTLKLNKMEILFGKIYNPKFNFDKLGKGGTIKHTDETKQKMRESRKGKNNPMYGKTGDKCPFWKNYARIVKGGFDKNKQRYEIRYEGKQLKSSYYIHRLYKWFGKNYPNQYLYLEVN